MSICLVSDRIALRGLDGSWRRGKRLSARRPRLSWRVNAATKETPSPPSDGGGGRGEEGVFGVAPLLGPLPAPSSWGVEENLQSPPKLLCIAIHCARWRRALNFRRSNPGHNDEASIHILLHIDHFSHRPACSPGLRSNRFSRPDPDLPFARRQHVSGRLSDLRAVDHSMADAR